MTAQRAVDVCRAALEASDALIVCQETPDGQSSKDGQTLGDPDTHAPPTHLAPWQPPSWQHWKKWN